ncbi:hypothetical protein DICPUDRAFT_149579 [Dictyostelium purpureum]|uniref:Calponin-homology (CH) domain-containing protein n=1 Tax=Dictyostelium purpureum TaxID=5786 RepID=F0ZE64_DICPU|nr:uncharacterized protein DICPUDRAFT_149579 [Dictyostelium purpureum]EGC37770.1 hypothetical protein DICPUDRAFT_149579 [Dictyostelium purpureum]|eukprot:XP_003285709.1 hypothetical protein DICPUDRAFT_149579 [Dictyostelium purpureum]
MKKITNNEKNGILDWINQSLKKDNDVKNLLPINENDNNSFKNAFKNGILLCKIANISIRSTIFENEEKVRENFILFLNAAKSLGCNINGVTIQELLECDEQSVLLLVWEVIVVGLIKKIYSVEPSRFVSLLKDKETIKTYYELPPREILIRWVNFQLNRAWMERRIKNFNNDIKDSEVYTVLVRRITTKDAGVNIDALNEEDLEKRASMVLENADKIGCKRFLKPTDIVNGNSRLNFAFIANIFNTNLALPEIDLNNINKTIDENIITSTNVFNYSMIHSSNTNSMDSLFRNWINSLGICERYVYDLYLCTHDGVVLITLFNKIFPSLVDHERVVYPPFKSSRSREKLENCHYVVELSKRCGYNVSGINGVEIYNKGRRGTLRILNCLMKSYYSFQIDPNLKKDLNEMQIIQTINIILEKENKRQICGARFLISPDYNDFLAILDFINLIKPKTVNYSLVHYVKISSNDYKITDLVVSYCFKIGCNFYGNPLDFDNYREFDSTYLLFSLLTLYKIKQ